MFVPPDLTAVDILVSVLPVLFLFLDRVLLHSPGCPGTHCVDQANLELSEICLILPPECWD